MPPKHPSIKNPFTRKSAHLRRNTRDSKWVSVPGPTPNPNTIAPNPTPLTTLPSPRYPVNIMTQHPTTYAASQTATIFDASSSSSSRQPSQHDSMVSNSDFFSPTSRYTEYARSHAFIYDVSEIPDVNIRVPDSPKAATTKPPQGNYVVSETHVSPLESEAPRRNKERKESPVSPVVEVGWGHVWSGTEKEKKKAEEKKKKEEEEPIIPFPGFDYTYPKPDSDSEHENTYQNPHKAQISEGLHVPPAAARHYQSSNTNDGIFDFYDRAREIYHAGPKGEGQKVWSGIRRLRKKRRAKRQANRQRERFEGTAFEEVKKDEGQPPSPPLPPPPPPMKDRPYPRLPEESERLYPLSPVDEIESAKRGPEAAFTSKGKEKVQRSSTILTFPSLRSIDIPLGASASVHYDAQNVGFDMSTPGPPALRKGNEIDVMKSLPAPPPPPPVPAKHDARSVPQISLGNVADATLKAARYGTLEDVQSQKPNNTRLPAREQSSEHLETRPPPQKEHKEEIWLSTITHLKVPPSPYEHYVEKHLTKRQGKLKSKIGSPQPMMAPGGQLVNIAAESGGIGGPAAAVSLPVRNGVFIDAPQKNNPKEKKKEAPPRPAPPPEGMESLKKKPTNIWVGWGPIEETSKYIRTHTPIFAMPGKHRSSDASFGCLDGFPRTYTKPTHPPPPGPSEFHHPVQPSAYAAVHVEDEDVALQPLPLLSGTRGGAHNGAGHGNGEAMRASQIRNTGFYQPYDDVLHEYGANSSTEDNAGVGRSTNRWWV